MPSYSNSLLLLYIEAIIS